MKKPTFCELLNTGGRGQNRTADTRIFNCKNHHLYSVLGSPSLAYARQSVSKLSRYMMPSDDLPLNFQEHLKIVRRWRWDGTHYEKTANAWLENMDKNRDTLNVIIKRYLWH